MKASAFVSFDPIPVVDEWSESYEEIPRGSRDKMMLVNPNTHEHYIFKYPPEEKEQQVWSELLASYIAGDLLGWDIQHTGIACRQGRLGNLLEYIYTPAIGDADHETFIEGLQLCKAIEPAFDMKKTTGYTLELLMQVCDKLLVPEYNLPREKFLDFWAKTLALDTLICNRDRHAANWAIVIGRCGARMAKLYDNGSSLGCEMHETKIKRVFDKSGTINSSHLEKRRKVGRHALRLESKHENGATFEEMCSAFLKIYPDGKQQFESAGRVDISEISCLMECIKTKSDVEDRYSLSCRRIKHICTILQIGVEQIRNALKGSSSNV